MLPPWGQVCWYTLEGRDKKGNATGGWDLHEIRTVQDYYVKYGLNARPGRLGGGFHRRLCAGSYQIDVNPDALRAYDIPLHKVMTAVKNSNRDVGAKTVEINQAEYLVRGIGYIEKPEDIEKAVVAVQDNVPVRIRDIAVVSLGPSTRRGALDKDGAGVVGGVVVARYGSNPMEVINNVKEKIKEIAPGLPKKTLADGTESQLTIVPFYDRSGLIYETLGTLERALTLQIIIAVLVVMVMVINLRASLLISSLLPISVLMVFIAMRYFGVDANIVALSGIAIAIGTMVDLGIILSENVVKHLRESPSGQNLMTTIYNGAAEVSSAILTAVSTTIVSFIPVFTMQQAEGKLFGPLAFTKTFALVAALLVSLFFMPTLAHWFFGATIKRKVIVKWINILLIPVGILALFTSIPWAGIILIAYGVTAIAKEKVQHFEVNGEPGVRNLLQRAGIRLLRVSDLIIAVAAITWLLATYWLPLEPSQPLILNLVSWVLLITVILGFFLLLERFYQQVLVWTLRHKALFMSIPVFIIILGLTIWLGFSTVFGFVSKGFDAAGVDVRTTKVWSGLAHTFPGMEEEFMPTLDEGSFLLMPTTMPHSGMELNLKVMAQIDKLVTAIPEVELTVGKMGRVESALDPAPISMFENVINYKPEYALNKKGRRQKFKVDDEIRFITKKGDTLSNKAAIEQGITASSLIPDKDGRYFRNWRKKIQSPDDIWDEVVEVTKIPGLTSAPKLQPIRNTAGDAADRHARTYGY
ncbi:MAG: efflux RND transporter permease subunit [Bacteroidales bacterium]|nr:efflux RND transporter permease subunit [Bacteroidales bacterium]